MTKVAKESFRVLKPGRQCAILIGDMRRKKHVIPLGFKLIDVYLNAGFKLRELVIKRQHNCKTTGFWYANSIKYNFLLLAHEYLPIFEKPITPGAASIGGKGIDYGLLIPTLGKPPLRRKLDELETTTVWVLPVKDFEKRLNKNVIDRYSNGKGYSVISFVAHSKSEANTTLRERQRSKGLLFIRSPFWANNPSYSSVEFYLQELKEIVHRELPKISEGGFIVIQTQDTRIGEYVEPLAKKVTAILTPNELWLKEIIIVTQDIQKPHFQNDAKYLNVTHQYLLVYEKTKGNKNG